LKTLPLFCLISIVFNSSIEAQPIQRLKGQSSDSLVHTILSYKFKAGNVYEFINGNNSFIIYSELTNKNKQIEEFYETSTLFNILYSPDKINYSNYFIDTLSIGNSCWALAKLDSLFLINIDEDIEKEICVVLIHVPYCDAYKNYVSVHFYDNIENFIAFRKLKPFKEFTFAIHHFTMPLKEMIAEKINSFLKEKPEIKK